MKKLLLSLVAMVFAIGVNAVEVVTNATSGEWVGDENGYTATINGYKISYLKHENNNGCVAPSADHIRVYKNGMLVIEAVDGSAITSLEITTTGGNYCSNIVVEGGDAVANTPLIAWTGNVTKFEGVTANSQVRIKSIKINEGVTEPEVFNPAGTGEGTVESPYNVERALDIINHGKYTNVNVYVKGVITRVDNIDTDQYGNATYFISDGGSQTAELEIYRGYSLGGQKFASADEIKVGDEVVVCGKLTLYGTTPEVTTGSSIYSINGKVWENTYTAVGNGTKENPYTVADIAGLKIEESDGNKYWVKGVILGCATSGTKLAEGESVGDTNIALGATADATTFIPVAIPVGDLRTVLGVATNPGNVGKEVLVCGTLEKYFSTAGVKNVTEAVIDGQEYSTAINAATVDNVLNGAAFNLAGQKVSSDFRGIVVKNGKKIVK